MFLKCYCTVSKCVWFTLWSAQEGTVSCYRESFSIARPAIWSPTWLSMLHSHACWWQATEGGAAIQSPKVAIFLHKDCVCVSLPSGAAANRWLRHNNNPSVSTAFTSRLCGGSAEITHQDQGEANKPELAPSSPCQKAPLVSNDFRRLQQTAAKRTRPQLPAVPPPFLCVIQHPERGRCGQQTEIQSAHMHL